MPAVTLPPLYTGPRIPFHSWLCGLSRKHQGEIGRWTHSHKRFWNRSEPGPHPHSRPSLQQPSHVDQPPAPAVQLPGFPVGPRSSQPTCNCNPGSTLAQVVPEVPWTPGDKQKGRPPRPWNGIWFGLRKLHARLGSLVKISLNCL